MNLLQNLGVGGLLAGALLYIIDTYNDLLPHFQTASGEAFLKRPPEGLAILVLVASAVLLIVGTIMKQNQRRTEGLSNEPDDEEDEDDED